MSVDSAKVAAMVQASLSAVQAAIAAVPGGDISAATPFQLKPVADAVNAEVAVLQSAIAQYDADIITTSTAGMVTGQPAPTLWPVLLNQVADSVLIAQLLDALGYMQRLAVNLSQALA